MGSTVMLLFALSAAQTTSINLRGTLVDSAGGQPILGAAITLSDRPDTTLSNVDGAFTLRNIPIGSFLLEFSRPGFYSRSFALDLDSAMPSSIDLGVLALQPEPRIPFEITGIVVDEQTQTPIADVAVLFDGQPIARTGPDGTFHVTRQTAPGFALIEVRHPGYAGVLREIWVEETEEHPELTVALSPLAVTLPALEVQAAALNPRLAGFYERRRNSSGWFITAEEIEQIDPRQTVDILRRAPGLIFNFYADKTRIRVSRGCASRLTRTHRLAPVFFVDGAYMGVYQDPNVNDLVQPQDIAAIEVYAGAAEVPIQYNATDSACGVILIWTK